ncbi:tyrosine-type recombinase/integrase [Sphingomonas faeni]|uniref:tyrosine-type recombinase/integrase n=1 Tax=Sphingomonas faeni TaxID=185950 RepID=UPI003345F696
MSRKLTLTPTSLEALRAGKISDPENPGLSIEVLGSGKKAWKFSRRLDAKTVVRASFGTYPFRTISAARAWAQAMNGQIEEGHDPREVARRETERLAEMEHQNAIEVAARQADEDARAAEDRMTVDAAHSLYMIAVRANDHKTKRKQDRAGLAPRTIVEKEAMYRRNVKTPIGSRPLASIVEDDLLDILEGMKDHAPVQANRTGAELLVFFKWTQSLRARVHRFGLTHNPAARLSEVWNVERKRTRWFPREEIKLFLKALAPEEPVHRRALLLLLLTGTRKDELIEAPSAEYSDGRWVLPMERAKSHQEHPIQLGPWGQALFRTNGKWVVPSCKKDAPQSEGWSTITMRVQKRMGTISGFPVVHWTLHDLRRTFRSHVDDFVTFKVAERMLNHKMGDLEERYNQNRKAESMAAGFLEWDYRLSEMAREAGVADILGVPPITTTVAPRPMTQFRIA